MRPESVPLLLVALLLVSAQPGVETIATIVDGDQQIESDSDAVIVVGGNVTVPADSRVSTSVYVVDGNARIAGTLDGRVTQLAGVVTAESTATVTGTYRVYGGRQNGDWFVTDVRFSHYGEETHVAVPDCRDRTTNGSFLGIAHTHPSADTAQSQPDRWNAMWSEEYEMHAIYASSDLQFYRGGDVPTELQHRQITDMAEYRAYRDRHPIDPLRDLVEAVL